MILMSNALVSMLAGELRCSQCLITENPHIALQDCIGN